MAAGFLIFYKENRKIPVAAPFLSLGMVYCVIQDRNHSERTRRESVGRND